MKKRLLRALAAMLALLFLFSVYPLTASAAVRCTLDGEDYAELVAEGGRVTLPAAPESKDSAFVGWAVTVNGEKKLYPPSATVEVSDGAVFEGIRLSFVTRAKAEMRINENDIALRFITDFLKADYQLLRSLVGDEGIKVGTYITVREYMLLTDGIFTTAALEAEGCSYLDVAAKGFFTETDTHYTLAGSVSELREENRARTYMGVGYLRITYADGSEGVVYSPFDQSKNGYTLFGAVVDAYEDRLFSYPHTVPAGTAHGGEQNTSSPYTLAQLDRMRALLDSVGAVDLTLDEEGAYQYVPLSTKYYVSPWLVSYEALNKEDEIFSVTLRAPEGKSISDIKSFLFIGSRIPVSSASVTVTETSITAVHSNYTPEY